MRNARLLLCSFFLIAGISSACHSATWHVPIEFPNIQAAIDVADHGDTVLVAAGSYSGTGNRDIDPPGVDLVLISESGSANTTIHCEASPSDPHRAMHFHTGESARTLVRGFTFRGGNVQTSGGAVLCTDGSSPTFLECAFTANRAMYGGGSISISESHPTFQDCRFDSSAAASGGAVGCGSGAAMFTRCRFTDNYGRGLPDSFGGAINCAGNPSPLLEECSFTGNVSGSGGAIYVSSGAPTLEHCVFESNEAVDGGAISCQAGTITVFGSRFLHNFAHTGAALHVRLPSAVSIRYCTFWANVGNDTAALVTSGAASLWNSIIAGTSDGRAIDCSGSLAVVLYCCDLFDNQEGNWTGCIAEHLGANGNFEADPLFCSPDTGDFTVAFNSPCVPPNHPQGYTCGRIGSEDRGCPPTALEPLSWGLLKSLFAR